jgi:hypothetical protein
MSITISGGGIAGITVETDPSALKLTGGTLSGELNLPTLGNLLNANLVVDSYNDTGAGTHYYHTFTPFDGKFNLATNGGGLTFPDSTTQTTAGLPLTGGTLSGKLSTTTTTTGAINFQVGVTPSNPINGDVWMGNYGLTVRGTDGIARNMALTGLSNSFSASQLIDCSSTSAGLRVTQRGTGHALLVEDDTNPDQSTFHITAAGRVAINQPSTYDSNGVPLPMSWADSITVAKGNNLSAGFFTRGLETQNLLSAVLRVQGNAGSGTELTAIGTLNEMSIMEVRSGGFKVTSGQSDTTAAVIQRIQQVLSSTGTYNREIPIVIDGVSYRIPCRQV